MYNCTSLTISHVQLYCLNYPELTRTLIHVRMLYYYHNSQSVQNDRPSMCTQFYKQLMSQITVHDACDVTCHMNLRIISCSEPRHGTVV